MQASADGRIGPNFYRSCRDPWTAGLVRIKKKVAEILGPTVWSEFLNGNVKIGGTVQIFKGDAGIHGPPHSSNLCPPRKPNFFWSNWGSFGVIQPCGIDFQGSQDGSNSSRDNRIYWPAGKNRRNELYRLNPIRYTHQSIPFFRRIQKNIFQGHIKVIKRSNLENLPKYLHNTYISTLNSMEKPNPGVKLNRFWCQKVI